MPAWLNYLCASVGAGVILIVLTVSLVALVVFAGGALSDAYRAHVERSTTERAQADAEERTLLKAVSLRARHDALLDALDTLVAMHRNGNAGAHEAIGNWDWALDRAEKALALAKSPLLTEGRK